MKHDSYGEFEKKMEERIDLLHNKINELTIEIRPLLKIQDGVQLRLSSQAHCIKKLSAQQKELIFALKTILMSLGDVQISSSTILDNIIKDNGLL